jgi:hypothetical protein
MQKVVGSNPIIRSHKAPLDGAFCCLRSNLDRLRGLVCAHLCPFDRPIVGAKMGSREAVAALDGLRVDAEGDRHDLRDPVLGAPYELHAAASTARYFLGRLDLLWDHLAVSLVTRDRHWVAGLRAIARPT